MGAEKFLGVSHNAPLGNFWGPCDFCISQNGPGHFRNGFLGIQKPARKSWKRFRGASGPTFVGPEALRNILGPPTSPKVSKRGFVESSEVGRDIPRIFSGQEKQKQIPPGEKVRAKEFPIVSNSFC